VRAAISSTALLLALAPAVAAAMPGQTMPQLAAWAKANPALHGLQKKTGDMSGLPYYTATFHAGSFAGTFMSNVGEDQKILDESVAVQTSNDSYDILKHTDAAGLMLATVYGADLAGDFKNAKTVGTWTLFGETSPTSLYRGKLYGYELAHAFVKLIPLAMVDNEAKILAGCVKQECGD
jgi:hypothetical protein